MDIQKLLNEAFDAGYKCGLADGKMEGCLEVFKKMREGR